MFLIHSCFFGSLSPIHLHVHFGHREQATKDKQMCVEKKYSTDWTKKIHVLEPAEGLTWPYIHNFSSFKYRTCAIVFT